MMFTTAGHWSLSCTSHLYLHLVSGLSCPFMQFSSLVFCMPGHLIIFDLIALIIFSKDMKYEIPHYAVFSSTLLLPDFLLSTHSHVRFVVLTSIIAHVMSHSLLRRYQGFTGTCRPLHLQDIKDRDSHSE